MEPSSPPKMKNSDPLAADAIRARAREIYERSGCLPGRDQENWLQAESEVLQERAQRLWSTKAYVVVRVKGVTYTGEYDPHATDYRAGELAGMPVKVDLRDDRMLITRLNGDLLETRVVKREPAP